MSATILKEELRDLQLSIERMREIATRAREVELELQEIADNAINAIAVAEQQLNVMHDKVTVIVQRRRKRHAAEAKRINDKAKAIAIKLVKRQPRIPGKTTRLSRVIPGKTTKRRSR